MSAIPVAVVGAPGVGKSMCIQEMKRYFKYESEDSEELLSIAGQLYRVTEIDMDFYEDAGAQNQVVQSYSVFIIVYAMDDDTSFGEMARIKNTIEDIEANQAKIIVIGNKVDLRKRASDSVTADCIISIDWGLQYLEVSALLGTNMDRIAEIFLDPEEAMFTSRRNSARPEDASPNRRHSIQIPCYGDVELGSINLKTKKNFFRRSSLTKFFMRCSSRLMEVS